MTLDSNNDDVLRLVFLKKCIGFSRRQDHAKSRLGVERCFGRDNLLEGCHSRPESCYYSEFENIRAKLIDSYLLVLVQ